MQFISVRQLRANAASAWRKLSEDDDVVITSNGKPIAVLLPVDEGTLEQQLSLVRRIRAQSALNRIHEQATRLELDSISEQEIEEEVASARKERRNE